MTQPTTITDGENKPLCLAAMSMQGYGGILDALTEKLESWLHGFGLVSPQTFKDLPETIILVPQPGTT
jgi:hypothetical protein